MTTLPQVVGRTEQALTRLLFTKGIADAPIATNDQWVALNVLASAESEPRAPEAIAAALSATPERAELALTQLESSELVSHADAHWVLTYLGRSTWETCRERVRRITADLTHGIDAEDREIVERTLDLVRARALALADVVQPGQTTNP